MTAPLASLRSSLRLRAAVLICVAALVGPTRLHAQQDVDEVRARAEAGDAEAQYTLASLYGRRDGPVARDLAEAATWHRLAAEQGHMGAQMALGALYLTGEGVSQESTEALRWFLQAAEQGNRDAQHNVGVMYQGVPTPYRTDHDVAVNQAEAVRWFRRAAEQGQAYSAANLGAKYRDGEGVAPDDAEAFRWFRLAADLGHAGAQSEVGTMYAGGLGVAQDDVAAYMWLDLATLRASGQDREMLLVSREAVAERMTAAQIAEAERRSREWEPVPRP